MDCEKVIDARRTKYKSTRYFAPRLDFEDTCCFFLHSSTMELKDPSKRKEIEFFDPFDDEVVPFVDIQSLLNQKAPKKQRRSKAMLDLNRQGFAGVSALYFLLDLHVHRCKMGQYPFLTWMSLYSVARVNKHCLAIVNKFKDEINVPRNLSFWHPFLPQVWTSLMLQEESLKDRLIHSYSSRTLPKSRYAPANPIKFLDGFFLSECVEEGVFPESSLVKYTFHKSLKMALPFENICRAKGYLSLLAKNWNTKAYDRLFAKIKNFSSSVSSDESASLPLCLSMSLWLALEFEMNKGNNRKKKNQHLKMIFNIIKILPNPNKTFDNPAYPPYDLNNVIFFAALIRLAKCTDMKLVAMGLNWIMELSKLCSLVWRMEDEHPTTKLNLGNCEILEKLEIKAIFKKENISILKSDEQGHLKIQNWTELIDLDLIQEQDKRIIMTAQSLFYFKISLLQNPDPSLHSFGSRSQELEDIMKEILVDGTDELDTQSFTYLMMAIYSSPIRWTLEDKFALEQKFKTSFERSVQLNFAYLDKVASLMDCDPANLDIDETWRRICLFRLDKSDPKDIEETIKQCKLYLSTTECGVHKHTEEHHYYRLIRDYLVWIQWMRLQSKIPTGGSSWNQWLLPGCKVPMEVPDYFWLASSSVDKNGVDSSMKNEFCCNDGLFRPIFGDEMSSKELCLLNRLVPVFQEGYCTRMWMDRCTATQLWLKQLEPKQRSDALIMVIKDLMYVNQANLSNDFDLNAKKHIIFSFLRFVQDNNMDDVAISISDVFTPLRPIRYHDPSKLVFHITDEIDPSYKSVTSLSILMYLGYQLAFSEPKQQILIDFIHEHIDLAKWKQKQQLASVIHFLIVSMPKLLVNMWVARGKDFVDNDLIYEVFSKMKNMRHLWPSILYQCFMEITSQGQCAFQISSLKNLDNFKEVCATAIGGTTLVSQIKQNSVRFVNLYTKAFCCKVEFVDSFLSCLKKGWNDTDQKVVFLLIDKADPRTKADRRMLDHIRYYKISKDSTHSGCLILLRDKAHSKMVEYQGSSHYRKKRRRILTSKIARFSRITKIKTELWKDIQALFPPT